VTKYGTSGLLISLSSLAWAVLAVLRLAPAIAAGNYSQTFDSAPQGWTSPDATYAAANGYYTNTTGNTSQYTLAVYGSNSWQTDFTYAVQLYSQYGNVQAPANAVGAVYGYQNASNYYVAWFNTLGTAELIRFSSGTPTIIAKGTYSGAGAQLWFNVQIVRSGTNTSVLVNGSPVITHISQPEITAPGEIGVFTNWDLGRFDNVTVTPAASSTYSENFDDDSAQGWSSINGAWNATGGYYANVNYNTAATIAVYNNTLWNTNYTYSSSLYSTWESPGNAVGVIYNYQDANDYYEVWFNALGAAQLIKVIGGAQTTIAKGSYTGYGSRVWFNVQITRSGTGTTVSVNNAIVFNNIAQPELGAGKIGFISSWNLDEFDNVTVTGSAAPATASSGDPFPRIGGYQIGSPQEYWTASYQQQLAKQNVTILSYWPGWGVDHGTTMQQVVTNIKSINPKARVFLYINTDSLLPGNNVPNAGFYPVWTKLNQMHWWAYVNGSSGPIVAASGYPASQEINNTLFTPPDSSGLNFIQWFDQWVTTNFYKPNPAIDGLFTDNVLTAPDVNADWNRDGITDSDANPTVATWYRQAFQYHFQVLHSLMPGKLQIGNSGGIGIASDPVPEYQNIMDGGVLEAMIGKSWSVETWGGWAEMMGSYAKTMAHYNNPPVAIFGQEGDPIDYQSIRYGLGSCLLGDAYYYFTDINVGYYGLYWFDEFNHNLGQALTPAYPTSAWQHGVYRRDFQNGIVLVNPKGNGIQKVTLETSYVKIKGTQDPITNNGQTVTTVTLQDRDGLMLLRP